MSEIETSSSAEAIIRALMALSKSRHPRLAAGIETEGQLSRKATSSGVLPPWSRLSAAGSCARSWRTRSMMRPGGGAAPSPTPGHFMRSA
jgi:hypothetical protein